MSRTSLSRAGSSPLARGLLGIHGASGVVRGIIPARAGFTNWVDTPQAYCQDHPRSRGVYECQAILTTRDFGSSSLARGLHYPYARIIVIPGIIPARAGFTTALDRANALAEDHPRSRGVYPFYVGEKL